MDWLKARYKNQARIHWYWMKKSTYDNFVDYFSAVAKNNGYVSEDFFENLEKRTKKEWNKLKLLSKEDIYNYLCSVIDKSKIFKSEEKI
jgi:molecular chaperone GrpE (heat shock protein)